MFPLFYMFSFTHFLKTATPTNFEYYIWRPVSNKHNDMAHLCMKSLSQTISVQEHSYFQNRVYNRLLVLRRSVHVHIVGVRLHLWTAAHCPSPGNICLCRDTVEWYRQEKTAKLGEKPISLSLCSQKYPHRLTSAQTWASSGRSLSCTLLYLASCTPIKSPL